MEFGMLQRVEDRYKVLDGSGLPPEMIKNTHELMCCFVNMCAYAYKDMRQGKFKTVVIKAKVALTDDDGGVNAELARFKSLVEQQNSIKGSVTLEEVKNNGGDVRELLVMATQEHELSVKIHDVSVRTYNDVGDIKRSFEENDKTGSKVERLKRIADKLGLGSDSSRPEAHQRERPSKNGGRLEDYNDYMPPGHESPDSHKNHESVYQRQCKKLKNINEERLPGTGEWLEAHDMYTSWKDSVRDSGSVLFLSGAQGTGKTFLASKIIETWQEVDAPDRRTAVAYYFFGDQSERKYATGDENEASRSFSRALRCMAYMLAVANTRYARQLENSTQWNYGREIKEFSCAKLWQVLDFSASRSTSFILIFDGLDQLTNPEELMHMICSTDRSTRSGSLGSENHLRNAAFTSTQTDTSGVRILVTVNEDRISDLESFGAQRLRIVPAEGKPASNDEDLELFMDNTMKTKGGQFNDMAQYSDHGKLFKDFRKHLLGIAKGRFHVIKSRIQRAKQYLEVFGDIKELEPIMFSKEDDDRSKLIEEDLEGIEKALDSREVALINGILTWIVWSDGPDLTFEEIDAIAVLNKGPAEKWRSFTRRITKNAYSTLFKQSQRGQSRILSVDKDILAYLRNTTWEPDADDLENAGSSRPKIDLTINITQADPRTVKRFLWDLQEKISFHRSFFTVQGSEVSSQERIHANEVESISKILIQCLNLLNEDLDPSTRQILGHASTSIPFYVWRATNIENERQKVQAHFRFPAKEIIISKLIAFLSRENSVDLMLAMSISGREPWSNWLEDGKYRKSMESWLNNEIAQQLEPLQKRTLMNLLKPEGPNVYLLPMVKRMASTWLVDEPDWENKGKTIRAFYWVDAYFLSRKEYTSARPSAEATSTDDTTGADQGEWVPPSRTERIWQAAELAQKLLALEEQNSRFYERVGNIYLSHGLASEAIKMFRLSMKNSKNSEAAYTGTAMAQYLINELGKAQFWIEKAIESSLVDQKDDKQAADRRLQYKKFLGLQYYLTKRPLEAIRTFEDIIEHDHRDHESHVELLDILWMFNFDQDAAKTLDRWDGELIETTQDDQDTTRLVNIVRLSLEENFPYDYLAFLPELAWRADRLDLVDRCLQQVSLHFKKNEDEKRHAIGLSMAYQGLILAARDRRDEGYKKAFEAWSGTLRYLAKVQERDNPNVLDTRATMRRLCAGYHLVRLKSSEDKNGPMNSIKELYGAAKKHNDQTRMRWTIASAHAYMGNEEQAKAVLRKDFDEAFEILTDNDPSNDLWGYLGLTDVCAHTNDIQNALVALSCAWSDVKRYDEKKEKYDARSSAKQDDAPQSSASEGRSASDRLTNNEGAATETSGDGTSVGVVDAETPSESEDDAIDPPEYEGRFPQIWFCNGSCQKEWHYPSAMWTCTSCEDVCFCGPCHDKMIAGTKQSLSCHRLHEFFYMPTWKRSMYERIGEGNVCIPKKVADGEGDDGIGEWSFAQGEIVSEDEWKNRVKDMWGVKKKEAARQDARPSDADPTDGTHSFEAPEPPSETEPETQTPST